MPLSKLSGRTVAPQRGPDDARSRRRRTIAHGPWGRGLQFPKSAQDFARASPPCADSERSNGALIHRLRKAPEEDPVLDCVVHKTYLWAVTRGFATASGRRVGGRRAQTAPLHGREKPGGTARESRAPHRKRLHTPNEK